MGGGDDPPAGRLGASAPTRVSVQWTYMADRTPHELLQRPRLGVAAVDALVQVAVIRRLWRHSPSDAFRDETIDSWRKQELIDTG